MRLVALAIPRFLKARKSGHNFVGAASHVSKDFHTLRYGCLNRRDLIGQVSSNGSTTGRRTVSWRLQPYRRTIECFPRIFLTVVALPHKITDCRGYKASTYNEDCFRAHGLAPVSTMPPLNQLRADVGQLSGTVDSSDLLIERFCDKLPGGFRSHTRREGLHIPLVKHWEITANEAR